MVVLKIDINKLQPSQLFISRKKLCHVKKLYEEKKIFDPVPIKELNNRLILTDGHTRAYYLFSIGKSEIEAEWDIDDLDWEMYQICVDWAIAEGILTIKNMHTRILSQEDYQIKWLKRCQDTQAILEERRKKRKLILKDFTYPDIL